MNRNTFVQVIGVDLPPRRPEDKRHGGGNEDKLYHGPLRISEDEAALPSHVYRTRNLKAAISARDGSGVTYVWKCPPAAGDFLGSIYRTPTGEYRAYIYKPATVEWRGEPRTVAGHVARFAPDPTIPQVTEEQERAYFLGDGAPLMPPIATPAAPLWQQEEPLDISQYITPMPSLMEE